ncbi:MAG: MarR family winged helix-turn-helix transcriptional regulator [Ktedonobacterales bacterium]
MPPHVSPTHDAASSTDDTPTNEDPAAQAEPILTKHDYERVAEFRYSLRLLLRQTELEAAKVGLTPQHYQLMLAVRGFPGRDWASITELAERLQIRHNAVIGLVNRAVARGLLERHHGEQAGDRRIVQVHLTPQGEMLLHALTATLRSERQRVSAAADLLARQTLGQ